MTKTISIVTPCFNEEDNVRECYAAVRDIFVRELKDYTCEHIFADNCSTDRTPDILREIAARDPSVKLILNARNFGPLRSAFNGVMASSGDAVLLLLAADQQDPPALIPQFVRLWEQGYEIVYGVRATREEGAVMRAVRHSYYSLLTRFSEVQMMPGVGDFQLVDRRVIEAMRQVRDSHPFMRMMTFECGGRSIGVPYTWVARKRGVSKNSIAALMDQGMAGVVSFTKAPLRLALAAGFAMSFLSILYALAHLVISVLYHQRIMEPNIMTVIVAMFFFGGVQLFFMGMIGEYVLAIHGQVRQRPTVFERERVNFADGSMPDPVQD